MKAMPSEVNQIPYFLSPDIGFDTENGCISWHWENLVLFYFPPNMDRIDYLL